MKLCRASLLALPVLALSLAACGRTKASYYSTLYESEPNDTAFNANYFGTVGVGSFRSIRGSITDVGWDPFDGFAFTAASPVTVCFSLYADDPFADLDVSVYDPQLGAYIALFESPFDPESGSFDVLAGGLDFHLVVDSYFGSSGYTLDVDVKPLFVSAPASAATGAALSGTSFRAGPDAIDVGASRTQGRARALDAYDGANSTSASRFQPVVGTLASVLVDEQGTPVASLTIVRTADGSWMGMFDGPGEDDDGE